MTDSPSAKRFASFLDRECCVWMPSASVALLSALVTGKGRPKRLLVQEDAPKFISNIGLITGAAAVSVRPADIDEVLEALLRTEGLSPDHVWGVATHRAGRLSPSDWLSKCAASGIPTIELCLGSLFALARWSPSSTTFTIVDLDAEEAFAGARLSALLTDDRALAERVQRLCLPGPEAHDYVFDVWPRGLEHDEPALSSLVERATAQGAEKSEPTSSGPAFSLAWTRRFQSNEGDLPPERDGPKAAPTPVEEDLWRSRLAEAAARHAEALLAAAAHASSLQTRFEQQLALTENWQRRFRAAESGAASRAERDSVLLSESQRALDERQRTIDQWEARFREAESEAARDAGFVTRARADLLTQKNESGQAPGSTRAGEHGFAQKLMRAERERDLAVADAAHRDESERKIRSEFKERVEQFEKAAASAAREARPAEAAEASRAVLLARVALLEADAGAAGKAHAELLEQKAKAEQALALLQAEKEALARKLEDLDAELGEALAEAAKRTATQRAALEEQGRRAAQLERDVTVLTSREAAHVRQQEALPTGLPERIAVLEAEKEALAQRLSVVESGRDLALLDAARREETQRSAMADQSERVQRLEADAAAHREREKRLTEEWARARADLSEQTARLEAEASRGQRASAELSAEKAAAERALARARTEAGVASEKLAEAERGHAQALADAVGSREAMRFSLAERIAGLEADAALAERARGELLAQKEESERGRMLVLAEKDTLSRKLAEAEGERDRALKEMEKRGEALRAALAEQTQRAEQSEKDTAVPGVDEARQAQAQAWEAQRAEMSERIARLEASSIEMENAHTDLVSRMASDAERAVASMRAEGDAVARKLAEVEKDRDLAAAETSRREEVHRTAVEAQRQRAAQLEKEAVIRIERETRLTDEWTLLQAELSQRIVRMEAAAVAAESAGTDLVAQKAEGDRTLASMRAENEALGRKLEGIERDHSTAMAEATRREDAARLALDAARRRTDQLEKDAVARVEREAERSREGEARSEWSERIRRAEDASAAAADAHADLLAQKNATERALESLQSDRDILVMRLAEIEQDRDRVQAEVARREEAHRAELDERGQLAEQLRIAAAAAAEREAGQAEAWEASRAELVARAARLEADGVISDKARNELLIRKRDSDRALAEAQAERVALLKKLATVEHERDQAQAAVTRPAADVHQRMAGGAAFEEGQPRLKGAAPGDSRDTAGKRDTGGLSALVSLWNTGIIRRPLRSKGVEEKPADPPLEKVLSIELIPEAFSSPVPILEREEQGKPDDPTQAVAPGNQSAREERIARRDPLEGGEAQPKHAASDSRDAASERETGGLSALVSLWNTAATMRPFRRKQTDPKPPDPKPPDPKPPDPPVAENIGMELMPDKAPSLSPPTPIPQGEGRPEVDRPIQSARPNPSRRSEPKPASVPDDTEARGGWLRGLVGRLRRKP